jgi:hypothetical protein
MPTPWDLTKGAGFPALFVCGTPSLRGALAMKQSSLRRRKELDCFASRNDGVDCISRFRA